MTYRSLICDLCHVVVEYQDWRRDAQRTEDERAWMRAINNGVMQFKKYSGGTMNKMGVRQEKEWIKGNPHVLLAVMTKPVQERNLWVWEVMMVAVLLIGDSLAGGTSVPDAVFSTCFFRHHSGFCTMPTSFQMTLRWNDSSNKPKLNLERTVAALWSSWVTLVASCSKITWGWSIGVVFGLDRKKME